MKIADTGLCYDRIFAFTDTSLRSLYRWTASCTLKTDLVCPRKVWLSTTKLMSRTWKIKRTTRRFLASYFHSSPCICWEEHIFDARTELEAAPSGCVSLEHAWVSHTLCDLLMPASPSSSAIPSLLHCLFYTV